MKRWHIFIKFPLQFIIISFYYPCTSVAFHHDQSSPQFVPLFCVYVDVYLTPSRYMTLYNVIKWANSPSNTHTHTESGNKQSNFHYLRIPIAYKVNNNVKWTTCTMMVSGCLLILKHLHTDSLKYKCHLHTHTPK